MDLGGPRAWAGWFLTRWRDMEGPPLEPDLFFHTRSTDEDESAVIGSYALLWLSISPTFKTYFQSITPTDESPLHVSWTGVSSADLGPFCRQLLSPASPNTPTAIPPAIGSILDPTILSGWGCFPPAETLVPRLPPNMSGPPSISRSRTHPPKDRTVDRPSLSRFVCPLCDKVLLSSYALKLHEGVHAGRKPFKCAQCQRSFSQKSHLTVHGRSHDGDKPFMCPTCGQCFSISSNLKRHLLRHDKAAQEGWDETLWATHGSSGLGETPADVQATADIHGAQLPCRECGQTFSSRSQLKTHQKTHSDDQRNQCNICDRICSNKTELSKHTLTHTGDRPHPCNFCGKRFVQKSQANHHMRTVHAGQLGENPRKYHCVHCSKAFTSNSILLKHVKIHTNERPHPCQVCGKTFIQKAHLHTHLLRHTGVKPFLCGDCGKCFTTQSNLREHIKTHSGEQRKYPCPTCPLVYSNPGDLKVHIRRHTGETPFQCGQCSKRFRARRHLVNHERIHTGVKPFSCHNCHKTFATPSGLGQHFKKHDTCRLTAGTGAFASGGPEVSRVDFVSDIINPSPVESLAVGGGMNQ